MYVELYDEDAATTIFSGDIETNGEVPDHIRFLNATYTFGQRVPKKDKAGEWIGDTYHYQRVPESRIFDIEPTMSNIVQNPEFGYRNQARRHPYLFDVSVFGDPASPGFRIDAALMTLRIAKTIALNRLNTTELSVWAVGVRDLVDVIDKHLSNNGRFPHEWITKADKLKG